MLGFLIYLLMIIALLFSLILFLNCSYNLSWPIWVKIAIVIGLLLILILEVFVFPLIFSELNNKVQSTATISITEIEEIYESGVDSTYFVKLKDSEKLQSVTGEIGKGNTNYIVKTEYTNLTDKLQFWLGIDKTSYTIVVTNPNVIKEIPEMK